MKPSTYRTEATAVGGRQSAVASVDGSLKAQLSAPRELGGAGGPGTNAEQLFAAAYAASFLEKLKALAAVSGQALAPDSNVTVTITLEDAAEGPSFDVEIGVDLPGQDRDAAVSLANQAHALCPYGRVPPGRMNARVVVP